MQMHEVTEPPKTRLGSSPGPVIEAILGIAAGIVLLVLISFLASLSLGAAVPQAGVRISVGLALAIVTAAACAGAAAWPRAAIAAGTTLLVVGLLGQLLGTSALGDDSGFWPLLQFGLQTFLAPVLGAALFTLALIQLRRTR